MHAGQQQQQCHNRPDLVLLLIDTPLVGFGSGPYDRTMCGRAAVVILDADRVVRVLGHNCASLSTLAVYSVDVYTLLVEGGETGSESRAH